MFQQTIGDVLQQVVLVLVLTIVSLVTPSVISQQKQNVNNYELFWICNIEIDLVSPQNKRQVLL